jgi:mycothiol synthase
VWTKQHGGGVGEVFAIAVRPRAAGRGLGRNLVLTGFADLAGRGGCSVGMLWADDANAPAIGLYRKLEMEPVRRRFELLVG